MESYTGALKILAREYKNLQEKPLEGFRVKLINENLLYWEVVIFGPPGTLFQGGYFKAIMIFPKDYPFNPPSLRFTTNIWHPNIFESGTLCISILQTSGDSRQEDVLPSETWNPTQSVATIVMSAISLLNEPNLNSPANIKAAKMYKLWIDTNGQDKTYENIVKKHVEATKKEAIKDGIIVPITVEDYCANVQHKKTKLGIIKIMYDLKDKDICMRESVTNSSDEDEDSIDEWMISSIADCEDYDIEK